MDGVGGRLHHPLLLRRPGDADDPSLETVADGRFSGTIRSDLLLGRYRNLPASYELLLPATVGPTPTVTLFFGNGGDQNDFVDIGDYAVYRNYQLAVESSVARPGHRLAQRPDLPYTFFSIDKALPTDPAIARWRKVGSPSVSFWYQPGRKSAPLYTEISQPATGHGFIQRSEPRLAQRLEGFSVEAWMAGAAEQLSTIDVGTGLRVYDGQRVYQVSALETALVKTYGLLKDLTYEGDPKGYWLKTDSSGAVVGADYTGLRLIRLTVDRVRGKVLLFVEDPNSPFLEVPLASAFPPSTAPPTVDAGVISDVTYPDDTEARDSQLPEPLPGLGSQRRAP